MPQGIVPWVYDLVLWSLSLLVDIFFREVRTRGSYKVPRRNPIIFVAAPHANQFVDPLLLMRSARLECSRRIQFLIAAASSKRRFIGSVSAAIGGISVARAQDMKKKCQGTVKLEDPQGDALILVGTGTRFNKEAAVGSSVVLPGNDAGQAEIAEVLSDTRLKLKRPFSSDLARDLLSSTDGTKFQVAPKVDQSAVYEQVYHVLDKGGCVGIFPEGGSHDRTELLPLKAGVSIMALGALSRNPSCGLQIVPVGMNYFHPHRFRSRAVIEFGSPIDVPADLVEKYRHSETKRDATKELLDIIYDGLASVTVQAADFETLQLIQAARRLYKPAGKKLPLQSVVELNRRFILGYNAFKDEPQVKELKADVVKYNNDLYALGVRDHQLTNLHVSSTQVLAKFIYRCVQLLFLSVLSLPGIVLFAPVFIATKVISKKKAAEALAGSTVKIKAKDVLATWKLLVAIGLVPLLYTFYTILGTWMVYHFELGPEAWRAGSILRIPMLLLVLLPMTCYSALRMGEIGVDVYKSLRPLRYAVTNNAILEELQDRRDALTDKLNKLIDDFAPEVFPDFDRIKMFSRADRRRPAAGLRVDSNGYAANSYENGSLTPVSPRSGNMTPETAGLVPQEPRYGQQELAANTLQSPYLFDPRQSKARSSTSSVESEKNLQQRNPGHVPMSRMRSTDSTHSSGGNNVGQHLDAASALLREELSTRMARKRSERMNSRSSVTSDHGS
ncbi:Glycerol-3-phosphate/dihydroxyacetone phosphate acyltransferase [Savitreella phatthalungensis]